MKLGLISVGLVLVLWLSSCTGASDPAAAPPSTEDASPTASDAVEATPPSNASQQEPAATQDASAAQDPTATQVTATLPNCRGDSARITVGRTDIAPGGNRHAPGGIDLLSAPMSTVELPAAPTWVVPIITDEPCRAHWYVTLDDGQAVTVDADGQVTDAGPAVTPPESSQGSIRSAHEDLDLFENPLPDSRVVTFGRWTAALVDPTERYPHGVLGDRIEAGAIEIINAESGESTRIIIDAPSVVEGLSPMLLDVDQADDAVPEVLVTLSNGDDGAWLALYNLDGTLRARSDAIGRGNRWRNQLGAAFTGPDGDLEIVDVRTPHLDGVVEFFRVDNDRLERVAATSGYTSHAIGSRNLDMGILVDVDADKLDEVVLPTRDRGSLAVLDRVGSDGVVELGRIDLEGLLSTNIASQWIAGQAWIAVGTRDGRLLIFGNPDL